MVYHLACSRYVNCDVAKMGQRIKGEEKGGERRNVAETDCVKSGPSKSACECDDGRRQKYAFMQAWPLKRQLGHTFKRKG